MLGLLYWQLTGSSNQDMTDDLDEIIGKLIQNIISAKETVLNDVQVREHDIFLLWTLSSSLTPVEQDDIVTDRTKKQFISRLVEICHQSGE